MSNSETSAIDASMAAENLHRLDTRRPPVPKLLAAAAPVLQLNPDPTVLLLAAEHLRRLAEHPAPPPLVGPAPSPQQLDGRASAHILESAAWVQRLAEEPLPPMPPKAPTPGAMFDQPMNRALDDLLWFGASRARYEAGRSLPPNEDPTFDFYLPPGEARRIAALKKISRVCTPGPVDMVNGVFTFLTNRPPFHLRLHLPPPGLYF